MSHYYTLTNRITKERTLVHANSRAHAIRGFAERRLCVEFTAQHELVELIHAGVGVLDLIAVPASSGAPLAQTSTSVDSAGASAPPANACRPAPPDSA